MRARDFNYNWMSAVAMLDEDHYIGAENSMNLFVCRKNNDDAADEARTSLEVSSDSRCNRIGSMGFAGETSALTWLPPLAALI